MKTPDLYDILGVPRDAKPRDIKAAYRKAATAAHPDKGGSDEDLQAINQAWETLGDPEKRARYDETGEAENTPGNVSPGEALFLQALEMAINSCDENSLTEEIDRLLNKKYGDMVRVHSDIKTRIHGFSMQIGRYVSRKTPENLIESRLRSKLGDLNKASEAIGRECDALLEAMEINKTYADVAPAKVRHKQRIKIPKYTFQA